MIFNLRQAIIIHFKISNVIKMLTTSGCTKIDLTRIFDYFIVKPAKKKRVNHSTKSASTKQRIHTQKKKNNSNQI